MSYPSPSSYSDSENGQPSSSSLELRVVQIGRDYNVNSGPGIFIVKNDSRVIHQTRPIMWYIRGNEEDEAEYDQYGEFRRSDVRLLQRIYHEKLKERDSDLDQYVPFDCEQSIWLGEILSGDGKGKIVTVVSYQGKDAPEKWKESFQRFSADLFPSSVHLLGLNRSKIPQLILLGDLVPAVIFARNIGQLGRYYLGVLHAHWGCEGEDLWMDTERGLICRGPQGPHPSLEWWDSHIEEPVATADLLKEDVLIRYMASLKKKEIDRTFVEEISLAWPDEGEPESVVQPAVIDTSTNTPIAVVNQVWRSDEDVDCLIDRNVLDNGWTRFRLGGDTDFSLRLNSNAEQAWLPQALSIFHARGISLEGDLSVFRLIVPHGSLRGGLSYSEAERSLRLQQPIYLFLRLPPADLPNGDTSILHYWSFEETGQLALSPWFCQNLGLPIELEFNLSTILYNWSTHRYKLMHQYQLLRGFEPTTTDFARLVGFEDQVFRPISDSDRFKVVLEGCLVGHDSSTDYLDPEHYTTVDQDEDPGTSLSSQIVNIYRESYTASDHISGDRHPSGAARETERRRIHVEPEDYWIDSGSDTDSTGLTSDTSTSIEEHTFATHEQGAYSDTLVPRSFRIELSNAHIVHASEGWPIKGLEEGISGSSQPDVDELCALFERLSTT
ncbi:hypothetical protein PQX77_007481 [Marasmius sp. AFHP31]|nr:hypothetical protein PQX77_007481 [Marasmius sp. AFHP31]